MGKISESKLLNDEAFEMAKDFPNDLFNATILKHKINSKLMDKEKAIADLSDMLKDHTDDDEIATIHYELWKMTGEQSHKDIATDKLKELYEKTPNYAYKKCIDEMSATEQKPNKNNTIADYNSVHKLFVSIGKETDQTQKRKRYTECIDKTSEIIKQDPNFAKSYFLRAAAYLKIKDYRLAKKDLEHFMSIADPVKDKAQIDKAKVALGKLGNV